MTREQAAKLLPVIQAFAEGKSVEWWNPVDDKWTEVINMPLAGDFRIKPTPREWWLVWPHNKASAVPCSTEMTANAHIPTMGPCEIIHVREVLE